MNTVINQHFTDLGTQKSFEKKMEKLIDFAKKKFPTMTTAKFHKDVKEFAKSFPKVAAKVDAASICKISKETALAEYAKLHMD